MARIVLALLCCLAIVGCGRIGFDHAGGNGDAFVPLGPFGTPTMTGLEVMNIADNDDPTLTVDQLEVYWEADGMGAVGDIYKATRTSIGAPWLGPIQLDVSSAVQDWAPYVSGDGLTLMFSSNRDVSHDIYISTRQSRTDVWSVPVKDMQLSSTGFDSEPAISTGGLELVMVRAGDLFYSTRTTTTSPWATPVPIAELNDAAIDHSPFFAHDDLELWFSSERTGGDGMTDIYFATRAVIGQPFGSVQRVTELATVERDEDPWLSPDRRTIYFARGNMSTMRIFVATR